MNDDRERDDRTGGLSSEAEGARERWYERLFSRFGLKRDSIRDDIEDALEERGEDAFSAQERAMLKNVLGFHRIRVDDVMVPRVDVIAVPAEATLGEVLSLFRTAGHSRLPAYGETLDDPKGMVHIRDFLDYLASKSEAGKPRRRKGEGKPPSLGDVDLSVTLASAKILRPVLFVPRSMPAVDLLVRMQTTRTHMALVIDEYGGTDGLVSIEDLVEMVVGDIEDEHDDAAARMIVREEGGVLIADARASLEEVAEAVGHDLAIGDMAEDVDTLGGLIATLAGRVPSRGELVAGPGHLEFEVLDADPRRLKRVRIHRRAQGEPPRPVPRPEATKQSLEPRRPAEPNEGARSEPARPTLSDPPASAA
jgi:CBS domain containing-hemolysin-like protein